MTSRVEQVADELYGLHPSEFTATRDQRAGAATDDGDRESAQAIRKLRKPSTSAWLANMLVRRRPDELAELADLGEALRSAQASLAGDELRDLAGQRRRLVDRLIREARSVAAELGKKVSEGVLQELETTVQAALVDPDAASGLAQGRLTTALTADQASAFGFGAAQAAEQTQLAEPVDLQQARARKELEKARHALAEAEQAVATRRREATEADHQLSLATARVDERTTALREAEADETAAREHADDARRAAEATEGDLEVARERARQAAAAVQQD